MKHKTILLTGLPFAVVTTLLSLSVYAAVQQNYRMSANDPQIQIAEDIAGALNAGAPADSVFPPGKADVSKTLSPYAALYDEKGTVVVSTAVFKGQAPVLPAGVFDYAKAHGEDRFSWQPEKGVRAAAVVVAFQGAHPGYVFVARSLTEVENRIHNLALMVVVFWFLSIVLLYAAIWAQHKFSGHK